MPHIHRQNNQRPYPFTEARWCDEISIQVVAHDSLCTNLYIHPCAYKLLVDILIQPHEEFHLNSFPSHGRVGRHKLGRCEGQIRPNHQSTCCNSSTPSRQVWCSSMCWKEARWH